MMRFWNGGHGKGKERIDVRGVKHRIDSLIITVETETHSSELSGNHLHIIIMTFSTANSVIAMWTLAICPYMHNNIINKSGKANEKIYIKEPSKLRAENQQQFVIHFNHVLGNCMLCNPKECTLIVISDWVLNVGCLWTQTST